MQKERQQFIFVGNRANIILLAYQEGILNERQIENGKHSMRYVTLKCEFI